MKLSQGSRVRPGDKLFAVIDSSQPVFAYIINRDEAGQSFLLFPLPGFDSNLSRPDKRLGFQAPRMDSNFTGK